MPELPEVETIRHDLEKVIIGRKIIAVQTNKAKVIKGVSKDKFTHKLKGDVFKGVRRRAKFLILDLKSKNSLLIHLKIAGSMRYGRQDEEIKFDNVCFILDNKHKLCFCDPRLFGQVELYSTDELADLPSLKKLGPEPLESTFTFEAFSNVINRKTKIKPLLMDQSVIAGIGNIYAAEALFLAGIHPTRPANKINEAEKKKLYHAIQDVLEKAIHYHGSSVDNYVDPAGRKGEFTQRLHAYGREGEPCYKCKKPIKRIELGGRGTYFCSHCQV